MEISTLLGVAAISYVLYFVFESAGSFMFFWDYEAFLIIFVGATSAILLNTPIKVILSMLKNYPRMFFKSPYNIAKTIDLVRSLSEKSKKEGIFALKDEGKKWPDQFLSKLISMVMMNVEPHEILELGEKDIIQTSVRHKAVFKTFTTAGMFSPVFGLFGTLVGVIKVLKNLSDPSSVGPSMAMAVMASIYGIFFAYILLHPVAGKLRARDEDEKTCKEILLEGMLLIQKGELPSSVERHLLAFLASKYKAKVK